MEKGGALSPLGRISQQSESARRLFDSLESGQVFKNAGIRYSRQGPVQGAAENMIRRALTRANEEDDWRTELEALRTAKLVKKFSSNLRAEDVNASSDDEEGNDGAAVAADAVAAEETIDDSTLLNRVLTSIAKEEIALLMKAAGTDGLVVALKRELDNRHHPLRQLVDAYASVRVPKSRASACRQHLVSGAAARLPVDDSSRNLLGILSEFNRYLDNADEIADALSVSRLTEAEQWSVFYSVVAGSRLKTLMDSWERSRSASGLETSTKLSLILQWLKEQVQMEELDSLHRDDPPRRAPLVAALARGGEVRGRRANGGGRNGSNTGGRGAGRGASKAGDTMTSFRSWASKPENKDKCAKCERRGHMMRECRNPLAVDKLSQDNPIRNSTNAMGGAAADGRRDGAGLGAFPAGPLAAYQVGVQGGVGVKYILDTGAAGVSYLAGLDGIDTRTIVKLRSPIAIGGVGGSKPATHGGTVYARVPCRNGSGATDEVVRFDVLVVPGLKSMGIGLVSPASFVHDGGFHAIRNANPPKFGAATEITPPRAVSLQLGAVGALMDESRRVEISCEFDVGLHLLPRPNFLSQKEIERLVPEPARALMGIRDLDGLQGLLTESPPTVA